MSGFPCLLRLSPLSAPLLLSSPRTRLSLSDPLIRACACAVVTVVAMTAVMTGVGAVTVAVVEATGTRTVAAAAGEAAGTTHGTARGAGAGTGTGVCACVCGTLVFASRAHVIPDVHTVAPSCSLDGPTVNASLECSTA